MNTLAEIPAEEKVEVERLKERGDVKTALEQAGAQKESALRIAETREKVWFSGFADVIDVSYLDTTLWEFGGQYLSTDHPTGRTISFLIRRC